MYLYIHQNALYWFGMSIRAKMKNYFLYLWTIKKFDICYIHVVQGQCTPLTHSTVFIVMSNPYLYMDFRD